MLKLLSKFCHPCGKRTRQDGKKPRRSKHYTHYSGRVIFFFTFLLFVCLFVCLFKANFDSHSLTDVPTLA